jgi:hypothetical protein
MKNKDRLLRLIECSMHEGAAPELLKDLEGWLGKTLPADYTELMGKSNGVEGFVSEDQFLVLWPVENLKHMNELYAINEFAPGLLLIGSDGGDTGFALDTRNDPMDIKAIPFVGMSHAEAKTVGANLGNFIDWLSERK